jgi:hypothetical protein
MYTKFWSENLRGRGHSKEPGIDGKIKLNGAHANRVSRCEMDRSASG